MNAICTKSEVVETVAKVAKSLDRDAHHVSGWRQVVEVAQVSARRFHVGIVFQPQELCVGDVVQASLGGWISRTIAAV